MMHGCNGTRYKFPFRVARKYTARELLFRRVRSKEAVCVVEEREEKKTRKKKEERKVKGEERRNGGEDEISAMNVGESEEKGTKVAAITEACAPADDDKGA